MSNREVKLELNDGRSAVIRGFIKNRDRSRYSRAVFGDKETAAKEFGDDGEVKIRIAAMLDANDEMIQTLLLDYCGNKDNPFEALMDSEYGDDYEKIAEAVQNVHVGDGKLPKE